MDRNDAHRFRNVRRGSVAAVATLALALGACSGGGGGGGGGGGDADPGPAPAVETTRLLGWQAASGPVAGYRVWVQRDGGSFRAETDVESSSVTLSGEPGEVARIMVAAFDDGGTVGPLSVPSASFTFPEPEPEATAANAAPAAATSDSRSFVSASSGGASAPASSGSDGDAEGDTDAAAPVAPGEKTVWDASGDRAADLLWESGGALRLTSALLETEIIFSRPDSDDAVAALADFDGDGLADPLWVGPGGAVGYTPMAGLLEDPSRTPVVPMGAIAAAERVVGAADFDGDGLADLLLRDDAGFTSVWLANRDAPPDEAGLGEITDVVAGVADYDADGNADILWRTPSGSLVVWQMAGALVLGAVEVSLPATAEILASGDFDGDGAADVAWRDPGTGVVSIVRPVVGAVAGWTPALGDTRGWAARGAADFDGDGTADLLLERSGGLRFAYLPGEDVAALDPASPWSLVALPR